MKKSLIIKWFSLALSLFVIFSFIPASIIAAEKYPSSPVKIIVPWSPGGVTDIIWRLAASYTEKHLGVPIVIENVSGASGTTGLDKALRSKPDGYTFCSTNEGVIATFHSGITKHSLADLDLVFALTKTPFVIATNSELPWRNMKSLVEDAKKKPNELKWAVSMGAMSHYLPLLIEDIVGAKFKIVGYPGDAQRMSALLGKHIDTTALYVPGAKEYLKAQKFVLLGITTAARNPQVPEVATLKEQGIDVVESLTHGLVAPKNTPKEVIETFGEAFRKASGDKELAGKLEAITTELFFMNKQEFTTYFKNIDDKYKKIAEKFKLQAK